MPVKDRFVEFCEEQLAPLGEITSRYMFGGWCLYCDGLTFALIAEGALYLKGDKENVPMFEGRGLQRFRPFEDQKLVLQYFQAPPEMFEDDDVMKLWCGSAIAAAERARKKPKVKRRKTP